MSLGHLSSFFVLGHHGGPGRPACHGHHGPCGLLGVLHHVRPRLHHRWVFEHYSWLGLPRCAVPHSCTSCCACPGSPATDCPRALCPSTLLTANLIVHWPHEPGQYVLIVDHPVRRLQGGVGRDAGAALAAHVGDQRRLGHRRRCAFDFDLLRQTFAAAPLLACLSRAPALLRLWCAPLPFGLCLCQRIVAERAGWCLHASTGCLYGPITCSSCSPHSSCCVFLRSGRPAPDGRWLPALHHRPGLLFSASTNFLVLAVFVRLLA